MGNIFARICDSGVVSTEAGHDETALAGLAGDGESSSKCTQPRGNGRSDVEERIESSKKHWSELTKPLEDEDENVAQDNIQVFEDLQRHPIWGSFFMTFNGYDTKVRKSHGELVLGEKFAEGGQAKLYHVKISYRDKLMGEEEMDLVAKVFKKCTCLRKFKSQWPLGYLQERHLYDRPKFTSTLHASYICGGTLLQDGRFAYLMMKQHEDLWSWIDRAKLDIGDGRGPIQVIKDKVLEQKPGVFSKEADVYNYGMTIYEVLIGELPFQGHRGNDHDLVLSGQQPNIPEYLDKWIRELLNRCWDVNPLKRPSFQEILEISTSNSVLIKELESIYG